MVAAAFPSREKKPVRKMPKSTKRAAPTQSADSRGKPHYKPPIMPPPPTLLGLGSPAPMPLVADVTRVCVVRDPSVFRTSFNTVDVRGQRLQAAEQKVSEFFSASKSQVPYTLPEQPPGRGGGGPKGFSAQVVSVPSFYGSGLDSAVAGADSMLVGRATKRCTFCMATAQVRAER
jgi:hypothetical protein